MGLIGNSSSGLIEAPSLGAYTINIGDRQEGRVRGNSVIDVRCNENEIYDAIKNVVDNLNPEEIINPYYKENSAKNYYYTTLEIIKEIDNGINEHPKRFYDISVFS